MGEEHGACCRRRQGGPGGGAMTEPAALAALLCSARHGYDLRRTISELSDGRIDVDSGGLYRVLRRLEEDGFVVSRWAEGDAGPQRREYELTYEGRGLADDWVRHLRERQEVTGILADAIARGLTLDESNDEER